jgi:hypothetical protein
MYEGYAVPLVQYLDDLSDQITPLSEKSSFIFSTESILELNAASKTVRIHHLEADQNALIGVVDETTFLKLAEFKPNADKVQIVAKLNKRYKNQPVALKKKINFDHDHEVVLNAAFDKQAQIDANTEDLKSSAKAAEDKMYEWYVEQLNAGVSNPHANPDDFIQGLTLPFAVYFTVLFPLYASYRVQKTAADLGIEDDIPVVAMTEELKQIINDFASREATSHVNTLKTDLENALAIIKMQTSDPAEIKRLFAEAYSSISARRSIAIASNAAARIFNISQYEADLQFLTRHDLIDQAYKVLFSLTGHPCAFCETLIAETNANPIPFTQDFASIGDTIQGGDKEYAITYENIIAGNVHPNCHCAYRLVIKNDVA